MSQGDGVNLDVEKRNEVVCETSSGKYVPWPKDVILYQPYEAEQILLPEFASCLAVRSYLNMCQLPYEIKYVANAEFMADSGRLTKLPVLRIGNQPVSEFEPIVHYINALGHGLRHQLKEGDEADMLALISYVENVFTLSELWFCYKESMVYQLITIQRTTVVYPWPLSHLQKRNKLCTAESLLKTYQWHDMNMAQVFEQVHKCCRILTQQIVCNNVKYCYGGQPSELDALVFGHLFAIMTTMLPNMSLKEIVMKYEVLVDFIKHFEEEHYKINKD